MPPHGSQGKVRRSLVTRVPEWMRRQTAGTPTACKLAISVSASANIRALGVGAGVSERRQGDELPTPIPSYARFMQWLHNSGFGG